MDALVRKANVDDAERVAAVLNAVIAEGKFTLFDRPFSTEDERNFISSLGPEVLSTSLRLMERSQVMCAIRFVQ